MDFSYWKEIVIAILTGGLAREIGGRLLRSVSKETELNYETEISEQMFKRAGELETRLLTRISILEETLLASEKACRQEMTNIRQEYEVRIGEIRHKHATEVTNLQVDLGKMGERCSMLERELFELRRNRRGPVA